MLTIIIFILLFYTPLFADMTAVAEGNRIIFYDNTTPVAEWTRYEGNSISQKSGKIITGKVDMLRKKNSTKEYETIIYNNNIISDQNVITYNENKIRISETPYKNGMVNGVFKWYDDKGHLKGEQVYLNDVLEGQVRAYYPSSKVLWEGTNKNGKLEGLRKEYLESGILKAETQFKNGIPDGLFRWYYENGKLNGTKTYRNGINNGTSQIFDKAGNLQEEGNFKNGKLQGTYKKYYENGKLKEQMFYSNGVLNGVWKTYLANGNLERSFNYKNGKKDGIDFFYLDDGRIYVEVNKNDEMCFNQYYPGTISLIQRIALFGVYIFTCEDSPENSKIKLNGI
jgi:antitoxin component YwqK of YwqJK toxin-antitoxin module